jgi:hypothetical protein
MDQDRRKKDGNEDIVDSYDMEDTKENEIGGRNENKRHMNTLAR